MYFVYRKSSRAGFLGNQGYVFLKRASALFFLAFLIAATFHATARGEPVSTWSGEAELGVVATRGNTDTETLNSKFNILNKRKKWVHGASSTFLFASDEDETTAQRLVVSGKTSYFLRDFDYIFITVRYEDDRFSGFDYRVIEIVGYGRRILHNSLKLAVEAGPGSRHSKLEEGKRTDELLLRASGRLDWEISETSTFTEEVSYESGDEGAVTESITSLKSTIIGSLAMKLALEIRHNSKVPAGILHTDSTTSVTLVYSF